MGNYFLSFSTSRIPSFILKITESKLCAIPEQVAASSFSSVHITCGILVLLALSMSKWALRLVPFFTATHACLMQHNNNNKKMGAERGLACEEYGTVLHGGNRTLQWYNLIIHMPSSTSEQCHTHQLVAFKFVGVYQGHDQLSSLLPEKNTASFYGYSSQKGAGMESCTHKQSYVVQPFDHWKPRKFQFADAVSLCSSSECSLALRLQINKLCYVEVENVVVMA